MCVALTNSIVRIILFFVSGTCIRIKCGKLALLRIQWNQLHQYRGPNIIKVGPLLNKTMEAKI